MLTSLSIRNIVTIDKLDIEFSDGFCVLTGETGAGKSILLDALGMALGKRASASLIRGGENHGSCLAVFDIRANEAIRNILSEQAIESEDELLLRRVIYDDGKSKAFVNDCPVSVGFVKILADELVEISSQHDQKGLLDQAEHMDILDQYAKNQNLLKDVESTFRQYKDLLRKLEEINNIKENADKEEDYLKYVLNEIDTLNPQQGEEEQLVSKRNMLMNKEKLLETVNAANGILDGDNNINRSIASAQSLLLKNNELAPSFNNIVEYLDRASIEINEALGLLSELASGFDGEDDNLESVEERLFALKGAARKYGVAIDDLESFASGVREKLDIISNHDQKINEIKKQIQIAKNNFSDVAGKLSISRKQAARKLEKAVESELFSIKMEKVRFKVEVEESPESNWNICGVDKVYFSVSSNPGSPFGPLAKVASGGELSRILLSMKVILSDIKSVPTIIFDEIDTGIGGAVADAVGRRMQLLGKTSQVLAITHQPQVASKGNYHLKVIKSYEGNKTLTNLIILNGDERREELARMLSGEKITNEALAAADKLMAV